MTSWNFKNKIVRSVFGHLIVLLFFIALILPITDAWASSLYGVERARSCEGGKVGGMEWDPTTGGKDIEFVATNPVCITLALTMYVPVKVAIATMNNLCGNPGAIRIAPSILLDVIDIAKCTKNAPARGASCVAAVTASWAAMGVAIGQLSLVFGIAQNAYDHTKVCGSEWYVPNVATSTMKSPGLKQTVQAAVDGYMKLTDKAEQAKRLSLDDGDYSKEYRQWYYGGVEVVDNVNDDWGTVENALVSTVVGIADQSVCRDPTYQRSANYDNLPKQKYYLKGLESGNYNCKKYRLQEGQGHPIDGAGLTSTEKKQFKRAYDCCTSRSREYICLEQSAAVTQRVFCKAGSKCTINAITYETKTIDSERLICAQSYSVCPYNFSVGGGTQYCDFYKDGVFANGVWTMITADKIEKGDCSGSEIRDKDTCEFNDKAGKCKNYCQYLTHCTISSAAQYIYNSSITSPYFSNACLDFVGDSQNQNTFSGGIVFGSQRHFSAPIAQCTKETLENLFHNRAGHTKCLRDDEYPSKSGVCASGNYFFQKDHPVQKESFFTELQGKLQGVVKMILTLSVMFYGANILMGKSDIREKKDILMYLLKIGLVMYFATGDAWQTTFFDGVYGSSAALSQMVFKIKTDENPKRQDGCQFGTITRADGSGFSSGRVYPSGKEYLAMWDTLDCKIARYLGFGPEASVANIAILIMAGFFTGPVGVYFALAIMFIGLFFVALTVRMLHIFLSSVISIVLMVFVSPIVIPMVLFHKTEHIFKSWLTNLISFCVQPMILFAYIAILIMVVDKTFIGSATFAGNGPMKAISCKSMCMNPDGTMVDDSVSTPKCDGRGQKIIDPMVDSIACLINVNSFGKFPGFELIGISIPVIKIIFSSNVKAKILTLLKGALVMYLLYKMADQIPSITATIIGGAALPAADTSASAMFKKINSIAKGVQERGRGAAHKIGGGAINRGKKFGSAVSNKGKSTSDAKETGGNSAADSGGGGGNSQTSSGGNNSSTGSDVSNSRT